MKSMKKTEKCLRVALATVRFDNVPKTVISNCLSRCHVPHARDILDYEYSIRRNLDIESFSRRLKADLEGWLGVEIRRLHACGLHPVLYVGFYSRTLEFLNVRVGEETVDRLAKEGQSIRFSFDSVNNKRQIVISIPNEFISMIAKFHFTLELS